MSDSENHVPEQTARDSELFARRLIDNLFVFVGVMELDGTLIEANAAPLNAAGISRDDVYGKKFWDCFWWDYSEDVRQQLQEAHERACQGEFVRYDVEVRMADDKPMPIDFQLAPLRNEAGEITHLIPSAVDITERKQAEEALQKLNQTLEQRVDERTVELNTTANRLADLLENLDVIISEWDLQTMRPTFVNERAEEILGYKLADWRDTPDFWRSVLLHPEDRDQAARYCEAETKALQDHEFTYRAKHQDGHTMWIHEIVKVLTDTSGQPSSIACVMIDITTRKRAELNARFLDELNAMLMSERDPAEMIRRTLQDVAAHLNANLVTFAEFSADFEMVTVQQEAIDGRSSVLGSYRVADFLTKQEHESLTTGREYVVDDVTSVSRTEEQMENFRRQQVAAWVMAPLVTENGLKATVAAFSSEPRQWRPDEVQFLRDLSARLFPAVERARAEAALRENEERLESIVEERTSELHDAQAELLKSERLATLGQLAGGVAHEMRTPLGVIRNAVHYLEGSDEALADPEMPALLREMKRAIKSSDHIISEMLDYVREPSRETMVFPIRAAIRQAHELVETPSNVSLQLPDSDDNPQVLGNEDQVTRILANLILNGVQAMPKGGELSVGLERRDEDVCIEVRDTGCGISPENLEKIFDPLFSTKTTGIGLGLAVSRRYAEIHGGSLEAESNAGEGTVFRLVLKAA